MTFEIPDGPPNIDGEDIPIRLIPSASMDDIERVLALVLKLGKECTHLARLLDTTVDRLNVAETRVRMLEETLGALGQRIRRLERD
ncbi:MAG: hypothetical protein GTO22_14455 [Gemmatimonadales bacterium]|nr:hypothetical protein [Gemmatimonadales bacterium]